MKNKNIISFDNKNIDLIEITSNFELYKLCVYLNKDLNINFELLSKSTDNEIIYKYQDDDKIYMLYQYQDDKTKNIIFNHFKKIIVFLANFNDDEIKLIISKLLLNNNYFSVVKIDEKKKKQYLKQMN